MWHNPGSASPWLGTAWVLSFPRKNPGDAGANPRAASHLMVLLGIVLVPFLLACSRFSREQLGARVTPALIAQALGLC